MNAHFERVVDSSLEVCKRKSAMRADSASSNRAQRFDPRAWLALASFISALVAPLAIARPVTFPAGAPSAHVEVQRYEHIASTILDSDELMLVLLPEELVEKRILSVSNFALDPKLSNVTHAARRVQHVYHRGQSELPLSIGAEVVFASPFSDAHAQRLWRKVNVPVVALTPATDLQAVRANIEICAKALGETEQGRALSNWMRQTGEAIRAATRAAPSKSILVEQSGYIVGERTLMDEMIRLAGLRNHAQTLGIEGHAPLSIAHIAQSPPDILARIDLRADEKRRNLAQRADMRALQALGIEQIELTPRYALSTSPYVLLAAAELAREVHGVEIELSPLPTPRAEP